MAIFALAQRTVQTAAANMAFELVTGANNAARLLEFGFTENGATAGVFGWGMSGGASTTPTKVGVLAEDNGNSTAGATSGAVAWVTQGTVPANFFRRVSMPASIGAGLVWTFPRGQLFLKNGGTADPYFWIIATAPVCDIWFVVDE